MAFYPAIISYDAHGQIQQLITGKFIDHHPIVSTYFLGLYLPLGKLFHNYEIGALLVSVIQLVTISAVYSFAIHSIKRLNIVGYISLVGIFAVLPLTNFFNLVWTKDALFSAFFLAVVVLAYSIIVDENTNIMTFILMGLFLIIAILLRKNMMYSLVIFVLVLSFSFKKNWKLMITVFVGIIVANGVNMALLKQADARKENGVEMLSVPLQQIAFIEKYNWHEVDKATPKKIDEELLPQAQASTIYNPEISDGIKWAVDGNLNSLSKANFVRMWISMVKANPLSAIKATLLLTRPAWAMNASIPNFYYSGPVVEMTNVFQNVKDIRRVQTDSRIPKLKEWITDLTYNNKISKIPLLNVIFKPALGVLLLFGFIVITLLRRQMRVLLVAIMILTYVIGVLVGPVMLIRYFLPVTVAILYLIIREMSGNNDK
ncbi:DUF6020 family protein [Weissella confusa]|uniref:DUF6020 family protein n=1 Tax=Weissella confusa TaxID=1583 RepID=UPI002E24313C|nr:DUF6020 family protein [Weissella confusa]